MSKPTLFFSHSSKDKDMVLTIKNKVMQYTSGTLEIFQSSDGESIPFGTNWIHKVEEGLREASKTGEIDEWCIQFLPILFEGKSIKQNHFRRWYSDVFRFIEDCVDLRKMQEEAGQSLVSHIINLLEDERDREEIKLSPAFLYILRKQSRSITNELDERIAKYLPEFYKEQYKLETTETAQEDLPGFIQQYVKTVRKNNATQGANGVFFEYGIRYAATIRLILLRNQCDWDFNLIDSVVVAAADTLLLSHEGIRTKLDSVSLLICIVLKFPEMYKRNQLTFQNLLEHRENIETVECSEIASNIDSISLKIGLRFLYAAMGIDVYSEILELMPYVQNDDATTISVAQLIDEYLAATNTVTLPKRVDTVILQNVMQWLHSNRLDVRCIATRILLAMARNSENEGIVNHQLLNLIDNDCVYIKNQILRRIGDTQGITTQTKNYIISKCENDPCYVVRVVCAEVTGKIISTE